MEDENNDGPFAVWQMFNAPTLVLFDNLEHAADGLERLLTSILKLSGDFSEVLVPRPGPNRYPDLYYSSFNSWLIGRLFYIWSVKQLDRIHSVSKDAQLKLMSILCMNDATFYRKLHLEYIVILRKLIEYYRDESNHEQATSLVLNNFVPDVVNIPHGQLNLQPIFVEVKDIETCKTLINLILQFLSDNIPQNSLHFDECRAEYQDIFSEVLYMLECFSFDLKLSSVTFFVFLISKYNETTIYEFHKTFPKISKELLCNVEAMVQTIDVYYDKGQVDNMYVNTFCEEIVEFLKLPMMLEYQYIEIVKNICIVIISMKNSKIFTNELILQCLSLSKEITFPENIISLQSMDAAEMEMVIDYYTKKIEMDQDTLSENWCYNEVMSVIKSLKSCEDYKIDTFVIAYHLKRCSKALCILQNVNIKYKSEKLTSNTNISRQVLEKGDIIFIWKSLLKLIELHQCKLAENSDIVHLLMDITLNTVVLCGQITEELPTILQILCLKTSHLSVQSNLNYNDDIKLVTLKHLLAVQFIMKVNNSSWSTMILNVINSFNNKDKSRQIIKLCPLILLNKIFTASKLISEILMPNFLTKDVVAQMEITEVLPAVSCIMMGNYTIHISLGTNNNGQRIFNSGALSMRLVCSNCHSFGEESIKLHSDNNVSTSGSSTTLGLQNLLVKFLNSKYYVDVEKTLYWDMVARFCKHFYVFTDWNSADILNVDNCHHVIRALHPYVENNLKDTNADWSTHINTALDFSINLLVKATQSSLESNEHAKQSDILSLIREFGISNNDKVILPATKLCVYFIMHPQCALSPMAVLYLKDICEAHNYTTNQVYHRFKKDFCKLFVECSLFNGKEFAIALLKVVRAFGFAGYRDFISKDIHHYLPYLIPYSVKIKEVPSMIEEIASLVQCSTSDFLAERFPHIYVHIYLNEADDVAKKCYNILERLSKVSILNLIKKHYRVILTEFLLQYCCNPERVLQACRYLACHDPDVSLSGGSSASMSMSTSQIADFLNPKFLGVLAYFDHKLVNTKVALSVKRKALKSFPDILQLMGVKYLTPLRYKVLATLRSALPLAKEFPKILAEAWGTFIHNIDSMSLGPLLSNFAVSLLQQFEYAPQEINKIFQYLVLSNENLLSSHISDLFFLEDSTISERVKMVIKKHVKRTQPEGFLDKIKWYLQHLNQDIPKIKAHSFNHLDKLLKNNGTEIHKAIFGGKNIDPVIVELIDSLLLGCKDPEATVSAGSGRCLGQLGAIEPGHLPRRYVQPDRSPFAFSVADSCFAATALLELARAFQYEKDTMNMDCYALTIQEILKIYDISPSGSKKDVWDSFPEHMHQIMHPLLSSRYTLAYPSQPKKAHPLYGSQYATTFLEWAHNWAGQLIPLIQSESIRELLRTVHPSMRRDVRTLFLFLPYVLLHAIMTNNNADYIREEMLAVVGLENFKTDSVPPERTKNNVVQDVRLTPNVNSFQAEEGYQNKCSKTIYTLLDFLNRWILEWSNSKQKPLENDNYKAISSFLDKFDKLTIARGNFYCGELERALQYLELYMDENKDKMQEQLPLLAEIYAKLDEPDSVAGILSIKRSEPSLKELILAQVVTGRLQDAALCYERLAQEGQLDRHSLQGMIDCYLGLDQPFTAHRLLSEHETRGGMAEMAAEALWRLGRFDQLEDIVRKPVPASRDNWGLQVGRILLAYRAEDHTAFESACIDASARLTAAMDGESKGESALRSGYRSVLGLHMVAEARHAEEALRRLKELNDGDEQGSGILQRMLDEWRRRLGVVQSDVRTVEPLLRLRRILLQQTQELLKPTHPNAANTIKACIGDLWLQSAKQARKAGIFQQSYMYILNAEEYRPEELFIEKAKMYWARGQRESAFTTLRRGLDDAYPSLERLTIEQRKICAKAKLLIAKYNDETTNVDVDVNIGYYKESVEVFKQWEKSLVCLGSYYEKVSASDSASNNSLVWTRKLHALNSYGKALQYGHKYLYQSMPRMLSIWLDMEVTSQDKSAHSVLAQMTEIINIYSERLPLYLYLSAFSQIVSRICHPVKEVYQQLKAIIVKLILAYPQHTLWMMMCVIKSSYPQRVKRCGEVFSEPRLKEPAMLRLVNDFTQLAEKLIELCNKPITTSETSTTVTSLVRTLPRLLASESFSHIMMPFQEFCKIVLPSKAARQERADLSIPVEPPVYIAGVEDHITILPSLQKPRKVTLKAGESFRRIMMPFQEFCKIVLPSKAARQERADLSIPVEPPVYIAGVEDHITILPSLQKPRKVTLKGSDGKSYIIMLKPRDDLRKDFRLMEFNAVVNRFLQDAPETRRRRLYIRTYSVLPLNEECGLIEWVPNLVGLRPILMHIYKQKGLHTSNRELKQMMCSNKDPFEKKRRMFEEQLLPRHPPVFQEWFRRVFSDPYGWYQARSAYIRTTAVMSMVGYILGLGDRHGENISFDSTNGDTVHVDFNCLFNKGESFDWPERVPFRLTHNMEWAMGPLKHEGMFRKSCEAVMVTLRAQTAALMSVVGPFVYDPLLAWGRARPEPRERTNEQALRHLQDIRQRLNGMVRTKNKQLSLSLSPEGQVEHLIVEATSIHNLCQMYIGWGSFL